MTVTDQLTPAAAGFSMPPEWGPHAGCLMSWPTRRDLWRDRLDEAKLDYAAVARAISDFEPLWMACPPGTAGEARGLCGSAIETIELPLDDSWARDNGPTFVRDASGHVAAVQFRFNAWGERWHPYADDARMPERIAEHLGMRLFRSPLVLEGGSFLVDGEGTLITTEQCLLNPTRNPTMSREDIEQHLKDSLGVTTIVWLPVGHSLDVGPAGTDGHIDGVLQYLGPAHVVLEAPADPASAEYEGSQRNLTTLRAARDARGRSFQINILDPGADARVSYANHYIANGGVIVPTAGDPSDDAALDVLASVYPGRKVVAVPGTTLAFGGGGPHCITQQIPEGAAASA